MTETNENASQPSSPSPLTTALPALRGLHDTEREGDDQPAGSRDSGESFSNTRIAGDEMRGSRRPPSVKFVVDELGRCRFQDPIKAWRSLPVVALLAFDPTAKLRTATKSMRRLDDQAKGCFWIPRPKRKGRGRRSFHIPIQRAEARSTIAAGGKNRRRRQGGRRGSSRSSTE